MNTATLTVAAIIPTYRRWPYMLATVKMLLTQSRPPDEIIIVDQTELLEIPAESQCELNQLKKVHQSINYLRQENPRVYEARNRAAHAAQSDILLYLDDDVVITGAFVERHLAHYADRNVHAVVGPALKSSADMLKSVPPGFLDDPPEIQAFKAAVRFDVLLENIGCMHAGNFSIRSAVLAALGGWDEQIITYGDRDLGIRLKKAGFRMDYDPDAGLVHLAVPLGGTRLSDGRSAWNSWQRCVSIHMLAWRHLWRHPWYFVKYGLVRAARFTFLLRRNAIRPWLWPGEVLGYFAGMIMGFIYALKGPDCSFDLNQCVDPSAKPA